MKIRIHNTTVLPGERVAINIPAGRLPTGRQVVVRLQVCRGPSDGPCVLFMGGMHGDEINGVEIVRRILSAAWMDQLKAGTIIAIPLLNVYGFINNCREVPGGKDINRSFPGSSRGSMAARLAAILSKKILPWIDWGIDFHTGSGQIYNYPQLRFSPGDEKAKALANDFAVPFLLPKAPIAKSMRRIFLNQGKSILIYEGGENQRLDEFSIDRGVAGAHRLLVSQGMLQEQDIARSTGMHIKQTTWLRAPASGIFQAYKVSGQPIGIGDTLAAICPPFEEQVHLVQSKVSGYIVGHANAGLVQQGDALFHIGQV